MWNTGFPGLLSVLMFMWKAWWQQYVYGGEEVQPGGVGPAHPGGWEGRRSASYSYPQNSLRLIILNVEIIPKTFCRYNAVIVMLHKNILASHGQLQLWSGVLLHETFFYFKTTRNGVKICSYRPEENLLSADSRSYSCWMWARPGKKISTAPSIFLNWGLLSVILKDTIFKRRRKISNSM